MFHSVEAVTFGLASTYPAGFSPSYYSRSALRFAFLSLCIQGPWLNRQADRNACSVLDKAELGGRSNRSISPDAGQQVVALSSDSKTGLSSFYRRLFLR